MMKIRWILYKLRGPNELKKVERILLDCYKKSQFDEGELRDIYIELFNLIQKDIIYAPIVLARLFSKEPSDPSLALEELLDAYFANEWETQYTFLKPNKKWKTEPESVNDLICIFAINNESVLDISRFSEFLIHLAKRHQIGRYFDSEEPIFTIKALEVLESVEEKERMYTGEWPYRRQVAKLLFSNSVQLIKKAVSILGQRITWVELESKFFVRYLSSRHIRKFKGIEEDVRRIIVNMGPDAVYPLDFKTQRVPIEKDDKWFRNQIGLTAAEMTKHFLQPFKGARLLESWVLRHRHEESVDSDSYFDEMKYQVLYDVIAKVLGIEAALSIPHHYFPKSDAPERLKIEFERSDAFPRVLQIIKQTGSPIIEGIMEDYIKWTIGSVLDISRPRISDDGRFVTGLFPQQEQLAAFVSQYLDDTPYWKLILEYLLTLGNEIGIRYAFDLLLSGLILKYPLQIEKLDRPRIREYSESLIDDIITTLELTKNKGIARNIIKNAPSLEKNQTIRRIIGE